MADSKYAYEGTETTELSIARVGGAVDPTGQAQSRKIVTSTNPQWLRPYEAIPYMVWNPTAGANVDVTVCGVVNTGALPLNDDLWVEVEYLGAGSIGKIVNTTKANLWSSNAAVAADGSSWNVPHTTLDGTPTGVTMSNGNLTAAHVSGNGGVISTAYLVGGKYYFEATIQVHLGATSNKVGIILVGAAIVEAPAFSSSGVYVAVSALSGIITNGNSISTGKTVGNGNVGDVYGVAVDLTARLAWFRRNNGDWNGDAAANPVTGIGGVAIDPIINSSASVTTYGGAVAPVVGLSTNSTTDTFTANFGQSAFANAAPSGFLKWDAGWTSFKLAATLNSPQPAMAGYIHARVRVAKPSATFYIDPKVTLTPAGGGTNNAATNYKSSRYAYEGTETTETSITKVGGLVDPTGQAQSRKIATTANPQWLRPFQAEPYAVWNPVTGANVTVTVCGTVNSGALPLNDDLWVEVEYLGAGSIGKIVNTTKANLLAANAAVASDSSSWNYPYFTFDTSSGQVTVSASGLTATLTTAAVNCGARTSGMFSTGKYYCEFTVGTYHGTGAAIGLLSSVGNYGNVGSNSVNGSGLDLATGNIASNGVNTGKTVGASTTGDVLCVAVDLTARLAWFRKNGGNWNGDATANPATGVGGVIVGATLAFGPALQFGASGATVGDTTTANFGASAYSQTAPAGFGNWKTDPFWTAFKLATTLSSPQPSQAGYIEARVKCAKPSSTYYIDPQIALS